MSESYVIGLDFGTDSVRSLLVNANDGRVLGTKIHFYERWRKGLYCNPSINQFRQHPLDYLEGMENTIKEVVKLSAIDPKRVKGICVDTTGSSPQALNQQGIPLCFTEGFEENPNAMTILWKDHTALKEAEEINKLARHWKTQNYTKYVGGIYSSEWFWAKILHTIRIDNDVKKSAFSWMEHCDLMTYILIGSPSLHLFRRSRCAAGHKAMWHKSWNGLPDEEFLSQLDPYLAKLKKNLYNDTFTSDTIAGNLSNEWATKLGLTEDTIVAVGTFDAHAGAVGAQIENNTLVRVMGTSTCDILVTPAELLKNKTVRGICGQVDGSVIPGMIGLEAGQSAFGDVLAWFINVLLSPIDEMILANESMDRETRENLVSHLKANLLSTLTEKAQALPINDQDPLALDWINGRRTPDADQSLQAAIMNLSLGSTGPHIFKALVEAICYGSKKIIDRFEKEGITINTVVGIGGVAIKSGYVMQTLADILNRPIKISKCDQAPALGAAIYAATASGIYSSVEAAIKSMGHGFDQTFIPDPGNVEIYQKRYLQYESLGQFISNLS